MNNENIRSAPADSSEARSGMHAGPWPMAITLVLLACLGIGKSLWVIHLKKPASDEDLKAAVQTSPCMSSQIAAALQFGSVISNGDIRSKRDYCETVQAQVNQVNEQKAQLDQQRKAVGEKQ